MSRRPASTTLFPMLLLLAACDIVDETGYYCEDGTWVTSRDMCADFGFAHTDEPATDNTETDGDLAPEAGGEGLILWTAFGPPGIDPVAVTVFGLPGAIAEGDVVTLELGATRADATEAGTTFTASIAATAGDTIVVFAGGDEIASVVVSADRMAVEEDDVDTTDSASAPTAFPSETDEGLIPGAAERGFIQVGDGALGVAAPYVVFNTDSGVVVQVAAGDVDVTIAAGIGEQLCLAPLVDQVAGPAVCVTVNG